MPHTCGGVSWCRWSSNDFGCDLYLYESEQGFEVNLATSRVVYREALPAPVPAGLGMDVDAFLNRHQQVSNMLEDADRVPIGLPFDGRSWTFDTPGETADKLVELAEIGYRFPRTIIDDLREEQVERDRADAEVEASKPRTQVIPWSDGFAVRQRCEPPHTCRS